MAATDEELAKQLWALGDIARLNILRLLPRATNCEHGNNVSQLAEKLGMTQPTVAHTLRKGAQRFCKGRRALGSESNELSEIQG